jgi:hypothetical protein
LLFVLSLISPSISAVTSSISFSECSNICPNIFTSTSVLKSYLERFKSSAMRHFMQWVSGEEDEDHAAAVLFNINAAEYTKSKLTKGNKRNGKNSNKDVKGLIKALRKAR